MVTMCVITTLGANPGQDNICTNGYRKHMKLLI